MMSLRRHFRSADVTSGHAARTNFNICKDRAMHNGGILSHRMTSSLAFIASPRTSLVPVLHVPLLFPLQRHCPCRLFQQKPSSNDDNDDDDVSFLQQELARIEAIQQQGDGDFLDEEDDNVLLDEFEFPNEEDLQELERTLLLEETIPLQQKSAETLEEALLQGVVPANAGVGSNVLTGDFGFDPLHLAETDYIGRIQQGIFRLIPGGDDDTERVQQEETTRPTALILRDYREAEIRHGRLAMLAAIFWPLQEMLDRLLLDDFGSVTGNLVQGGITLPYIPLLMTAIMLLMGYLDIFRQQLKEQEKLGEAFLPGDCFWDPLQILSGAPDSMKRNMQERELFNGRVAMLGIAVFIWEEARTGKPIISIPGNELLFEPAYQVPYIQEWLDSLFGSGTPPTPFSEVEDVVEGVGLDDLVGME